MTWQLRTACITWLLLLLLLALPATVQAQLSYTTQNGKITITGYTGSGGAVSIPDTIDGRPVTSIGDYAFSYDAFEGCTSLTGVTIPNSVTIIGRNAFAGCTSLTAITVDALNSVYSSVDGVLFDKSQTRLIQCPGGKAGTYTIPNSVTSFGEAPFSGCTSLTSVTIPNSVTSIADYAFNGLTSLTSVTIPNSVTSIGYGAFYGCTSLTSVTIPNSVTRLDYAFYDNRSLTSVTIPNSVTRIGSDTFLGCTSLTNVTLGTGVTSIGDYAFYNCNSLTSVTIPNSVTSIEYGAFYGCTSLTSVTFGNSVATIGSEAFAFCTSLTSVMIGNSVATFGGGTFSDSTNLQTITVDALNSAYGRVDGVLFNKSQTTLILCPSGKAGSYTIPNSVTSIEGYSFFGCTSLTNITIPNTVTSIGDAAFNGCTGLTSVTIPNSVTNIGDSTFRDCTSLANVTIPNRVTSIGSYAFAGCTNLTGVTIPNSVTTIGSAAFLDCTSLTSVTIPKSITSLGRDAFNGCTTLTAITVDQLNPVYTSLDGVLFNKSQTTLIQSPGGKAGGYTVPASVTSIGDGAFFENRSLTSVTIPSSVTSLGWDAFAMCISLTSVTIPNSVTTIDGEAFAGCPSLTEITVDALNSSYSSVSGVLFNKSQTTLIQCPGGKTGSYTIPNSVTFIMDRAFTGCTSLTSVTLPNSVTTIGSEAFSGCTSLTSVTIPNSVASIGGRAFSGCISLTGVYFQGNPPSLPVIFRGGEPVFDGADNATLYYLPGTKGWGRELGGRPTALWRPQVQASDASFGVRANQFGFNITWASSRVVVIEASTELVNPVWFPLQTNTLTGDAFYFSDPQWTNYPSRFYRIRSP